MSQSSSALVEVISYITEQHAGSITPTTKMISRLIEESKRSTLFFINLNSEILDNFVRFHHLQVTVEVNNMKSDLKVRERKVEATILHLESYVEFEMFFHLIRPEHFLYDGHFIIVYDRADVREMEKMFSKLWEAYIYNVNVLVVENGSSDSVFVFTYMPFANEFIANSKPIRINAFDRKTWNWTTNAFFPKKFKQLNRYPLRFNGYHNSPRFITHNENESQIYYSGIAIDIVTILSNALNATLNILEYKPIGNIVGRLILANISDFSLGSLQPNRVDILSATETIYSDALILVVPPPFLIGPMTKIFLPFTIASWISIGMVAMLAFCVVKLVKLTPKILQDYVIGSNVTGSLLNVWKIFLGGSLQILPRKNFPRFLLAKFLIFTLIIRSLYQGKIFDIMKKDVRTVELKTIDQFIEHEFTFYISEYVVDRLQGSRVMKRFGNNGTK